MLRLTDLIGRPVVTADGTQVGTVTDLVVHLERPAADPAQPDLIPHPEVSLVAVGRRGRIERYLSWDAVDALEDRSLRVRDDHTTAEVRDLEDQELLLARDVLDTQVFDIEGRRLARVAEVYLSAATGGRLHAAAVDVGLGAVWHRVGLRPLARRAGDELVDWRALHLTSARGHPVQLATTRAAVHRLGPVELAGLISEVSTEVGAAVLASVSPERAAAAVDEASEPVGDRLLRALPVDRSELVLDHLDSGRAERVRLQRAQPWPWPRRFSRHRHWRRRRGAAR